MPTVIDSLILKLGLDPTDFTKGQKEAAAAFTKTKDEAVKSGTAIEESGKKSASAINDLTIRVLELYAVFLGGRGLKEFITDISKSDAALGRLSANMSTTPESLSAFTMAIERNGGSAQTAASSYQSWSDKLQDLKLNGQLLPDAFYRLQALSGTVISTSKGASQSILDISEALHRLYQTNPTQANFIGRALGFDPETINFLEKGRAAVRAALDESQRIGVVTAEMTKNSQALVTSWTGLTQASERFGDSLLQKVSPALADVATKLTAFEEQIKTPVSEWIGTFVTTFAKGLHVLGEDIQAVMDKLRDLKNELNFHVTEYGEPNSLDPTGKKTLAQAIWDSSLSPEGALREQMKKRGTWTPSVDWLNRPYVPDLPVPALGTTRGLSFGGRKSIDLLRSGNEAYLPNGGAGAGRGLEIPLKSGGLEVGRGNPLPVTIVSTDAGGGGVFSSIGASIDGLLSNIGGGGGGHTAGRIGGGKTGSNAADAPYTYSGPTTGAGSLTQLIDDTARKHGLDPRILEGIRSGESLHQKKYDVYITGREQSYGPFQLNRMHKGDAGWQFEQDTAAERKRLGLGDLRDPRTIALQVDWVARYIKAHGTGPWRGGNHPFRYADPKWQNSGYDPSAIPSLKMPLIGAPAAAISSGAGLANHLRTSMNNTSNAMHIGEQHIHTNATDGVGTARAVTDALARMDFINQANYGIA